MTSTITWRRQWRNKRTATQAGRRKTQKGPTGSARRSTTAPRRGRARGQGETTRMAPRGIKIAKTATGSATEVAGIEIEIETEMAREVAGTGTEIGRRRETRRGIGGTETKRGRRGRRRGKEKETEGTKNGKRERGLGGAGVILCEIEKENEILIPEIAGNAPNLSSSLPILILVYSFGWN